MPTMHTAVVEKFRLLLDSAHNEADIQSFIEQHPWMLTSHGPVVAQLPLGSEFRVDFAFGVRANGGDFLNLIEIERPDMEIFNANDEFSQSFNHSIQQIIDWSEWCARNRPYVHGLIGPLFSPMATHTVFFSDFTVPRVKLIAGRREQISNERRKRRFVARAGSLERTLEIQTYDDFVDSIHIPLREREVECVRYNNQAYSPKNANET